MKGECVDQKRPFILSFHTQSLLSVVRVSNLRKFRDRCTEVVVLAHSLMGGVFGSWNSTFLMSQLAKRGCHKHRGQVLEILHFLRVLEVLGVLGFEKPEKKNMLQV